MNCILEKTLCYIRKSDRNQFDIYLTIFSFNKYFQYETTLKLSKSLKYLNKIVYVIYGIYFFTKVQTYGTNKSVLEWIWYGIKKIYIHYIDCTAVNCLHCRTKHDIQAWFYVLGIFYMTSIYITINFTLWHRNTWKLFTIALRIHVSKVKRKWLI